MKCQACGESTTQRFTVDCAECGGDVKVCGDCVNRIPTHEKCPEEEYA